MVERQQADRALNGVVVDIDAALVEKAHEDLPARRSTIASISPKLAGLRTHAPGI